MSLRESECTAMASATRSSSARGISDEALECVMAHLDEPMDRRSVSLVCQKWHDVDALTRKHVTVAFCYSITAADLTRRFRRLESLTVKGKPRASMYNLLPPDWGGYAKPWIDQISFSCLCLKSLHLRRMIVTDHDLGTLVRGRGHMLQSLKLEKCSGFSTRGLEEVARGCRSLKILMLEESIIDEESGDWLHELALHNSTLEVLNFYMATLEKINISDLEQIVANCPFLNSLKVSECDILDLKNVLQKATALEEFGGGCFGGSQEHDICQTIAFPPKLTSLLGLNFMAESELPVILSRASSLKKLDLQYTILSTENHCQLVGLCINLEVLEVRNVIGDKGLEVVANNCKKLKRLRVERGADEPTLEDEQGWISHKGISFVAQGCPLLEYIAVYVSDICNSTLKTVGEYCKNLKDFRLVLLDKEEQITDLPLDNGVKALLQGCEKLNRFAFYVRPGALTDIGLSYIGKYSTNVRWMLLGFAGETDLGILEFSKGCPKLERLEVRGCFFSEAALASAVLNLKSLKYIWVQGYNATVTGANLLAMARPYWNIEFSPGLQLSRDVFAEDMEGEETQEQAAQILAYYSLAGRRTDHPKSVIPLAPAVPNWQQVAVF
ncbi:hypothetical protein KI387_019160 [Taxus chinensis]|uniref:Coronatine-insensitive protein 1 n=1 Tax=Taxus chinensis TaxID=29808 RepID=A0AA38LB73_TAXCH|nr:hypothetical protein KI387_019160 [Taxus chinensis]